MKIIFSTALFISTTVFAYTTTPFNLAQSGYQGLYASETLENGSQLGSHAIFCNNVDKNSQAVAETLYKAADKKGILKEIEKEKFFENLVHQVELACYNQ